MIIRSLATGVIISKATKENGKYVGKILEEKMGKWEIPEDVAELHLIEDEIQQRIEAAVAEHLATTQEADDLNEYLRDKVKFLETRIAEMEAQRQPVEVSAELAEAIEWYKNTEWPGKWPTPEGDWMGHFLLLSDYYTDKIPSKLKETLGLTSLNSRKEIIKRGYIAPDPLRTRIAAILGNDYEQLDAVVAAAKEE